MRDRFNTYYNNWKNETAILSCKQFDNKWFNEIVEMGVDAVPFIKEKLEESDDWVVVALDRIFPNVMEYKGYVPLEDVCKTWLITLNLVELNGLQTH